MRELSFRTVTAFILCLLLGGVFAFIARGISHETIVSFDKPIIDTVQGWEAPWLTPIMKIFTTIGSTSVVLLLLVVIFIILYYIRKERGSAYLFAAAIVGTGILNQVLKFIFKRERPTFHRLAEVTGYSFPSGHTMMAFSLYLILAYIVWRHIRTTASRAVLLLIALFMIVMIGLSRIYLGVHYPSDIAGGMAASAFWLIVLISVYQYYQKRSVKKLKSSFPQ